LLHVNPNFKEKIHECQNQAGKFKTILT